MKRLSKVGQLHNRLKSITFFILAQIKKAMLNEEVLKRIFNARTFSKREAEKIVGSRYRLQTLVDKGLIRVTRQSDHQHAKWFCNGWDVLKHAQL